MHNVARPENFVPVGVLPGARTPAECCHFALSFFATVDQARTKFEALAGRVDAKSRYGTHVGKVNIESGDGVLSEPSKSGHLDLHENEGIEFVARVEEYFAVRNENVSTCDR